MTDRQHLPAELPEKPEGWTKRLVTHARVTGGGYGCYAVFDAAGDKMPFSYIYRTGKNPVRGYTLPEVDEVMTWAELCASWPEWLKSQEGEGA